MKEVLEYEEQKTTMKMKMKMTLVINPSNYHKKSETQRDKYDTFKKIQLNFFLGRDKYSQIF